MYRVIFKHHPKAGCEEAFIAQWRHGSDIIQTYPGACGTKLFRKTEKPDVLYAMADWKSRDARDRAMETIKRDRADAEDILHGYAAFLESRTVISEFELVAESEPLRITVQP